jgi:hypothetical protein
MITTEAGDPITTEDGRKLSPITEVVVQDLTEQ